MLTDKDLDFLYYQFGNVNHAVRYCQRVAARGAGELSDEYADAARRLARKCPRCGYYAYDGYECLDCGYPKR